MVLLSLGAQLVETVLIRGTIYTVELGGRAIWWIGSTAIGYVWPATPEPTAEERMAESIRRLQAQVIVLEERESRLEAHYSIASVHGDAPILEEAPSSQEPVPGQECEEPQPLQEGERVQGRQRS